MGIGEGNSNKDKLSILKNITFGKRIAEEEGDSLAEYFVETDQWARIFEGNVDIVYGGKGAGKSAIYSLLDRKKGELLTSRHVIALPAENPRGTIAFRDLVANPPASEEQFRHLWKLYFLCVIAKAIEMVPEIGNAQDREAVLRPLQVAKLIPQQFSLKTLLASALDYVRRVNPEAGVKLDPNTGMPVDFYGKISLQDPTVSQQSAGIQSTDDLFEKVDKLLSKADFRIWLLLDRLDVAFAETEDLEKNALRALFRVYLDLLERQSLSLKVFLRGDIWKRITSNGFREASHVTRNLTLEWNKHSLLNLVIRRSLYNERIRTFYSVVPEEVLSDYEQQEQLFYRIFPKQVEIGQRRRQTFEWILSRTADGTGLNTPRELIHLLECASKQQIERLERGQGTLDGENLFEGAAFKEALPEVSRVRLEQTLYAEYPALKRYLQDLEGEKTDQTIETVANTWKCNHEQANEIVTQLIEIGFFMIKKRRGRDSLWVPFLYRPALGLIQGAAEEGTDATLFDEDD
jgi:hypothetical protein